ncbi:MAG: hypothetical protein ACP5D8_09070 [Fidelibacterota bacterium]
MNFLPKTLHLLLWIICPFLILAVLPDGLDAQNRYYLGGGYEWTHPVDGLNDRFEAEESPVFSGGWDLDGQSRMILDYRFMLFNEINRDKLPHDSLAMELSNYSGGLVYQYEFWQPFSFLSFYVQAGISLNQWNFTRDTFHAVIPDSLAPITLDLDVHKRSDWSWGGRAGGGVEWSPLPFIHLGWHADFHLIAAELWPAESLGMESVSGLKMWDQQVYLRMSYAW